MIQDLRRNLFLESPRGRVERGGVGGTTEKYRYKEKKKKGRSVVKQG
jgi:hypothetical protein